MRRIFIAGNWKMNNTLNESKKLAAAIRDAAASISEIDVGVFPAFPHLVDVANIMKGTKIITGAQNIYYEKSGAYTGEVSPLMLKDISVSYVICGHSERRLYFRDTDETVNKKLHLALECGLKVIMCIGESLDDRDNNLTKDVVRTQLLAGLEGIEADEMEDIVIAYEPVWAIGTGRTATVEQAGEVHEYLRGLLKRKYNADVADKTCIQYGGSVKPENIKELINHPDIDGALVGGASLKAESFIGIIKQSLTEKS